MKHFLATLLPLIALACGDSSGAPRSDSARPDAHPDSTVTSELISQPTIEPIIDAAGVAHVVSPHPTRIISLVPSATETLVAIGARELIIARTDFDEMDEVSGLPSIGAGLQPNLEAILALDPDLVIYFYGSSDEATPRRLSQAGIRAFGVRPDRIHDVRRIILDLGRLTGRTANADALLAGMDSVMAQVSERIRGLPTVRTVFSLGGDPPWVAGPDSYISELITAAGGENVFSDISGLYSPASLEEFLVREIDVILMGPHGEMSGRVGALPIRRLPAFIEVPGPRLHLAARAIAQALHPDAFR